MKNEAELCTSIVRSLDIGYKIPDSNALYSNSVKRCFDIFGSLSNCPVYIEAKFNKSMSAFNLNRIEPHQAEWLNKFLAVFNSKCYIILGIYVGRADTRAYIFDWKFLKSLYEEKASIHAKVLKELPFNPIKKGKFEFKNIIESF